MNTVKRFLVLVAASFCMLGLGGAANAADQSVSSQICFNMESSPTAGSYNVLKLGIADYGNGHLALAGTDNTYARGGTSTPYPGIVHGSADWVGNTVEISLDGAVMYNGGLLIDGVNASQPFTVHTYSSFLQLNPSTLRGSFVTISKDGSTSGPASSSGTATVIECP